MKRLWSCFFNCCFPRTNWNKFYINSIGLIAREKQNMARWWTRYMIRGSSATYRHVLDTVNRPSNRRSSSCQCDHEEWDADAITKKKRKVGFDFLSTNSPADFAVHPSPFLSFIRRCMNIHYATPYAQHFKRNAKRKASLYGDHPDRHRADLALTFFPISQVSSFTIDSPYFSLERDNVNVPVFN